MEYLNFLRLDKLPPTKKDSRPSDPESFYFKISYLIIQWRKHHFAFCPCLLHINDSLVLTSPEVETKILFLLFKSSIYQNINIVKNLICHLCVLSSAWCQIRIVYKSCLDPDIFIRKLSSYTTDNFDDTELVGWLKRLSSKNRQSIIIRL